MQTVIGRGEEGINTERQGRLSRVENFSKNTFRLGEGELE